MVYEPAAVIDHHHYLDLSSFVRQHFNYGRGAYHFHRLRRARGRASRLEPIRFYRDLVLFPFGRQPVARALLISTLLCLAQFANAAGFFWQTWKNE